MDIYTVEYYLTMKWNEVINATVWWTIKHEKWKKPTAKNYTLYNSIYMQCPEETNPEAESRLAAACGWSFRIRWEMTANGVSFWRGNKNVLRSDYDVVHFVNVLKSTIHIL